MHNTPNPFLMQAFGTERFYRDKLAGRRPMVDHLLLRDQAEQEKVAHVLPWGGSVARMHESAELAMQAGELMAKQAGIVGGVLGGIKDFGVAAAKLPFQAAGAGAKAAWNTSRATKLKALPIAAGLGLGGAAIGAGYIGSKGIENLSNMASVPEGQEHVAHVLSFDEVMSMSEEEMQKHALQKPNFGNMARQAKAFIGGGAEGVKGTWQTARSAGAGLFDSAGMALQGGRHAGTQAMGKVTRRIENAAANSANQKFVAANKVKQTAEAGDVASRAAATKARLATPENMAKVKAAPAVQPPPPQGKPARMSSKQRRLAAQGQPIPENRPPQQASVSPPPQQPVQTAASQTAAVQPAQPTQPTVQPQEPPPPVQQNNQAPAQQAAATVQTPQEAAGGAKPEELTKQPGTIRRALPWVAGGLGLGAAGLSIGTAMMGNKAVNEMRREGRLPNTYTGYGAPIAGSASPYGYVTGPGM